MKIATWNLESVRRLDAARKSSFYDAIKEQQADVWILTETWKKNSLEPIADYVVAAQSLDAKDLDVSPERCWVSIWVRKSIAYMPIDIRAQQDRIAGVCIKTPEHPSIVVIGTVLPWLSDKLWPGAKGFCSAVAEQSSEWTRIRAEFDDCIFLLAGDFNQSLPGVSRYGSRDGEIALSVELRSQDLFCLSSGFDSLTGRPRIDHICISRGGLHSPYFPAISEWFVPACNGKPVTDHVGIAIELTSSRAHQPCHRK